MKQIAIARTGGLIALVLAAIVTWGCSEKLRHLVLPNQLPVVRITGAPIDSTERCDPDPVQSCYSLTINWVGYDPDGRVDHYQYAVDPPSAAGSDTNWVATAENEQRVVFRSENVISSTLARGFHVFVLRAVDNVGAIGPFTYRAFFSYTEAPTVQIQSPQPSALLTPVLPPSVRISWSGQDNDGVFTNKPVKYKYLLLTASSTFPISLATQNPDSLRRYYAPLFVGWDSTSADTTTVQFTNLIPNQKYLFTVIGIDEAGAYSPVFNLNSNMYQFQCGFAGQLGPKITVFNEFFEYSYRGGYCACAQFEVFIEVPAHTPLNMNWFAEPPVGADIRAYRWALDIDDVSDDTPRTDEEKDLKHWSFPSVNTTSVRLKGPQGNGFEGGEEHRLYIEAQDNVGLRSLAIIRFQVVQSTLEKPLLVVKDYRFSPDQLIFHGDCTERPKGAWPMAAELDTFLFARGGFPYKCYPTGTMSSQGILDGYAWDSLGTRIGVNDLTVPLSVLGPYQHVIWMVDGGGANMKGPGTDGLTPSTALRYMTAAGRFNALAVYIRQGGQVWLNGGGGAMASTIEWNDAGNDRPTTTFSVSSPKRELVPGRFMYDVAHWQSEFRVVKLPILIQRSAGRLQVRPDPSWPYTQYLNELPATMARRTTSSDPMPPNRTNGSDFYPNPYSTNIEFLQLENPIIEDTSTDPDSVKMRSTLDTLYSVIGNGLPRVPTDNLNNTIMTYYHGPSIPQGFIFSGFAPWDYQRASCKGLFDFVLQRMWGLMPAATSSARAAGRTGVVAGTPTPIAGVGAAGTFHGIVPRGTGRNQPRD